MLSCLLTLSGSMSHLPEVAMFIVFHSILMVVGRGSRSIALGSTTGLIAAILLYLVLVPGLFAGSSLMLALLASTATALAGVPLEGKLKLPLTSRWIKLAATILLVLYTAAVSEWPDLVYKYNAWELPAKSIPVLMYPVYLGLTGLLALLYLARVGVDPRVCPALILLAASFAIGKLVTLANLYILYTGYWELRFLQYQYVALSILAGGGLLELFKLSSQYLKSLNSERMGRLLTLLLLVAIVVSQALSTSLYAEYFQLLSSDAYRLSRDQVRGVGVLRSMEGFIAPMSTTTSLKAVFAVPLFQLAVPEVIAGSEEPSIPLLLLSKPNVTPVLLFMDSDWPLLVGSRGASLFYRYMVEAADTVYESIGMRAYRLALRSPPSENASIAVVYEPGSSVNATPLAIALSSLGLEYTFVSASDPRLESYNVLLTCDTVDEERAASYLELASRGATLIVVGFEEIGALGKLLLEPGDTVRVDSISTRDTTVPLPEVEVQLFKPRNAIRVLVNYTYKGSPIAPLAFKARVEGAAVIYVNLYPLAERGVWFKPLYHVLELLLGRGLREGSGGELYLVEKVGVEGVLVNVYTTSILEVLVERGLLVVSSRRGFYGIPVEEATVVFREVKSNAVVRARKVEVQGGETFYPRLLLEGYFEVDVNSTIVIELENYTYVLKDVESMSVIQDGRAVVELRSPLISCKGCSVEVYNLYSEDLIYAPIPLKGWSSTYRGDVEVKVLIAGNYLVVPLLKVDGVSVKKPRVKPRAEILWNWERRLLWEIAKSSPIVVLTILLVVRRLK